MGIDLKNKVTANDAFNEMMGGKVGKEEKPNAKIDLRYMVPYPNQPFKPYTPEQLDALADDIKINGLLSPIVVRHDPENKAMYQILSGHNRKKACELLGWNSAPVIVKDVNDMQAQLIMTSSNLNQRHELLPSEKAYGYKQQLEAYENLGAHNVRTTAKMAEDSKESKRNIQYYIRLTELAPDLLDMVDDDSLPMRAGVALSYLSQEEQEVVYDFIGAYDIHLTVKQAEKIRKLKESHEVINETTLEDFLNSTTRTPSNDFRIPYDRIEKFFDEDMTMPQKRMMIEHALEYYIKEGKNADDD